MAITKMLHYLSEIHSLLQRAEVAASEALKEDVNNQHIEALRANIDFDKGQCKRVIINVENCLSKSKS